MIEAHAKNGANSLRPGCCDFWFDWILYFEHFSPKRPCARSSLAMIFRLDLCPMANYWIQSLRRQCFLHQNGRIRIFVKPINHLNCAFGCLPVALSWRLLPVMPLPLFVGHCLWLGAYKIINAKMYMFHMP